MHMFKSGTLALAIAAASASAFGSSQSESAGFIEDASLELLNRNYYLNADLRGNDADEQSYAEEWAHGVIGVFQSGFTQGTVGFGIDAIGLLGLKLDTGGGRAGAGLLELDNDGKARDEFSQFGAAIKARISNTELKVGSQFVEMPVFTTGGDLLPEIAEGAMLTSTELDGLVLSAGRLTALSGADQSDRDSVGLRSATLFGGAYDVSEQLSASLYHSDIKDAFDKYYAGLTFVQPLDEGPAWASTSTCTAPNTNASTPAAIAANRTPSGAWRPLTRLARTPSPSPTSTPAAGISTKTVHRSATTTAWTATAPCGSPTPRSTATSSTRMNAPGCSAMTWTWKPSAFRA